jgi:hypothetical protein
MADEQTPQSDLIDDAIRQAERQLEEKLQALRMSALGEPAPATSPPADDVAVLRPTGSASRASEPAQPAPTGPVGDAAVPNEVPMAWQEAEGDDVTFAPADTRSTEDLVTGLYVPENEHPLESDPASEHDSDQHSDEVVNPADSSLRSSLSTSVTDLTPIWDEEVEQAPPTMPTPTTRRQAESADRPEPVHSTWTDPARARREPSAPAAHVTTLPSEDEMQFWAHTRTALRNLQQVTDGMTTQVVGGVSTEVARLLHEELGATDQSMRNLQQQVQSDLPQLADRIQQSIEQSVAAPNNAIRQVRDEIPSQLERATQVTHDHIREELDRSTASVHGAVQHDISQLEQSIASNVTRMAQDTTEAVGRVEHDVDVLGETVVRFERGVHSEFDRFEAQLRSAIERVEQNLRDELVAPTETIRKLDDELPARFGRIERGLVEQLQGQQHEMSTVLSSLVDADRAALDRLASLGSTMDEDRARRAEDLEVLVDTVTTGWEGLAGAMTALFEQADENSRRLAGIEQRLGQLRDVEGALEQTLDQFQRHMSELKPSPIVVTVSHDEAEVRNTTRSGWVADDPG